MKLTDFSNDVNKWFDGSGPMSDVVISSRIRLARNLAGYKFLSRCSAEEKTQILEHIKQALLDIEPGKNAFYYSIDQASELDRNFLVERHLISRHHAKAKGPRGAVIACDESFTAMINEEDHLRLQVLMGGMQLAACAALINELDNLLEQKLEFAFDSTLGYLTACPTNLGTGIRVSVMLHLPALKMTGQIDKFLNACKSMSIAVRGLFGEGTEASGDFYQISNQVTLGVSEQAIISKFEHQIVPEIVEYENTARQQLLESQVDVLDDKVARAMALLQSAHLMSSQEAMFLLSHLRLGLNMHEHQHASTPAIDKLYKLTQTGDQDHRLDIKTVNRLFMLTLPAHLQLNYGGELDPAHRDALRATVIRAALGQQQS